jgi:hypothetical protein
MAKFIGRRLAIGIGRESSRGVGVAPTQWLNALSYSVFDKATKARSEASTGGIWGGNQSLVARKFAEGEIECEMDDQSFGLILYAVFGNCSSAVKETTAYNHTFTLQNDAQCDSLSIHTSDSVGSLMYEMSMVDKLTMTFKPEELVKYTVGFKAKNSSTAVSTPSYAANNKFLGRQLNVKIAATTADLTAASKLTVASASLTINKNTEIYNVIGSVQPTDIVNKKFTVSGELELAFDDYTYMNYVMDGSYKALRLDLINNAVTIGGSSNPEFKIDLSKVDFDAWDVSYPLDDLVMQKVTFTALYDLGSNNNVVNSCVLTNTATSY